MKVAFVTLPGHAVQPAAGSVEIWAAEVGRRLAARHEVLILASRSPRSEDGSAGGIAYRFVAHVGDGLLRRVARPAWRLLPDDKPFFASMLYPLGYWVGVGRALRRERVDVAHVFYHPQALPILRRLAPRTKLVLHMHCEWLMQLDERVLARRLRHAGAILACSEPLTNGARERFPKLADRCRTVPNGTDVEALGLPREARAKPKRLLYVGRISPEKGLHVLVDAFAALHAERPELELVLVGEEAAPPPEALVRLAASADVRALESFYAGSYAGALRERLPPAARHRVRFAGVVPYADVAEHYRAADVFVLPSLMEAFGMPLAEALAAGVPSVAARTGGIVDVVDDGVTGLLVEPGSADALAAALRRLLDEPELRASLAAAGRAKARARFGWDQVAEATEAQHAGLLGQGRAGGGERRALPAAA